MRSYYFPCLLPDARLILVCLLSFLCSASSMNFWKPGEQYPDGLDEENVKLESDVPLNRMGKEITKTKVQLSERMKNMSVLTRDED